MKIQILSVFTLLTLSSLPAFAQSEGGSTQIAAPAPIPQAEPIEPAASAPARPGAIYYSGYSGGMMVHTGYISGGHLDNIVDGENNPVSGRSAGVAGTPTGIGGAARIHIGPHLRIGSEGHVSTLNYGPGKASQRNLSHVRIGWGGVFADYSRPLAGRWSYYAGGLIGGGSFKNIALLDDPEENNTYIDYKLDRALYRSYSFVVLSPFAGIEFALSDKMHLNLKADWMFRLTNHQDDFASGPRLYFGFTFYRMKD
jgi:hypothetical protein